MGSRRNSFIILGFVAILVVVAAYMIFVRQPVSQATQLGLDLEGGVSVQLEGYQDDGSEVTREEMDQAVEVIRQRVDSLGVTEPEIQIQGQDQVSVNIPGITDPDRAVQVIGRTAQLGFYEVLAAAGGQPVGQDQVDATKEDLGQDLRQDSEFEEGQTKILFEETPVPDSNEVQVAGYIVSEQPQLRGNALESASLVRDEQGRLEVQIEFTGAGFRGLSETCPSRSARTLFPRAGRVPDRSR